MWTDGAVNRQSELTKIASCLASWRWNAVSISWRIERICSVELEVAVWQNTHVDARNRNSIREGIARRLVSLPRAGKWKGTGLRRMACAARTALRSLFIGAL